jgi:cell division protein FtsQ
MDTKQKKRPPAGKQTKNPTTRQTANPRADIKRQPEKKEEPKISADVVYLPPKPFNRSRLALRLITVVAVVLALVLGLSIFFKVEVIEVSGLDKYTAQQVVDASGIKVGNHLLTFGRTKAAGKIISSLPYVKSVRIGIKLPNTVKIEIVETDVTYALEATDGSWWLMSAEGKLVEKASDGLQEDRTKIIGVKLDNPTVGQQAVAWQNPVPPTDEEGNPIPVTVTAAERLNAAISIAGFLEQNKIIGKIASIDVNQLMDIQLWYGTQWQILLGGTDDLGSKIASIEASIKKVQEEKGYYEGIIDLQEFWFHKFP